MSGVRLDTATSTKSNEAGESDRGYIAYGLDATLLHVRDRCLHDQGAASMRLALAGQRYYVHDDDNVGEMFVFDSNNALCVDYYDQATPPA